MKNIQKDFDKAKNKSILFLGKFHSLNVDEIKLFLEQFDVTYTDVLTDEVVMFVESTIISPLEEEIAYTAYKQNIPNYRANQFEELYADALNSDSILMSLKLSNNQERLARLLQNMHLDNRLFLKLFNMYDWQEEGLFDNSENMEVCTLFAKRFYHKERFDPATFYSPISIFEIGIMSDNPEVLEVLLTLPDISVKQSRSKEKRPTNLKEALATNNSINEKTFNYLVRLNDKDVDYFLATSSLLNDKVEDILYGRSDEIIKMQLATNPNISDEIFNKLKDDKNIQSTLFSYQPIDSKRFENIEDLHPDIGMNENLSGDVIQKLIDRKDRDILSMLCANESIGWDYLQQMQEEKFYPYLASNKNLKNLQELYEKNDRAIDIELAANPATPAKILKELFNRDDFEINKSLAINESMMIEDLQQLQLDTRLLNYLKENETFTKNLLNNLGI